MANAALELAHLLYTWRVVPAGRTVIEVRGGTSGLQANQVRASTLLASVLQAIAALEAAGEPVDHYEVFIPAWSDAVFFPNEAWNTAVSGVRSVLSEQDIAALRGLGRYLDKSGFKTLPATPDSLAAARESVASIVEVLRELDLDDATSHYVFTLVTEVRTILDAEAAELSVDLIRRVNELRGALADIADRVEAEQPTSEAPNLLRSAAQRLLPHAVKGVIAIDLGLNTAANYIQLTQGPAAH